MYKVFIENKPLIFQINSQHTGKLNLENLSKTVSDFLNSEDEELKIEINDKKEN